MSNYDNLLLNISVVGFEESRTIRCALSLSRRGFCVTQRWVSPLLISTTLGTSNAVTKGGVRSRRIEGLGTRFFEPGVIR